MKFISLHEMHCLAEKIMNNDIFKTNAGTFARKNCPLLIKIQIDM